MYIGESIDAIPTPIPPMKRYITKAVNVGQTTHRKAETVKRSAESIKIDLRPYLSLNHPAIETPATHPTSAELTYHPSMIEFNPNWVLTELRVPDITAV